MSGGLQALQPTEDDISKMLMAGVHLGAKNVDFQMRKYVFKRKADGTNIINIHKTWEKIMLAARMIAAVENPKDVCVISARPYGQRAILKFASHTNVNAIAGRFTPGTFTNQIQAAFMEPRLLVVTDPRTDHQPVAEAAYVNIPTIALCDTDTPMRYIDCAIPCNNKSIHSIGLIWWFLAREVLRIRGQLSRTTEWEIMPDLYFYRDPEEVEKEEQQAALDAAAVAPASAGEDYQQWQGETEAVAPVVGAEAGDWNPSAAAPPAAAFGAAPTEDWGSTAVQDWSATTTTTTTTTTTGSW